MGQYADDIIDGNCDQSGDYTHEFNQKRPQYKPRGNKKPKGKYRRTAFIHLSPAEKNIRTVRKELAILIKKRLKDNVPNAVEGARQIINKKYGKGWRERGWDANSPDQWKPLSEYK